MSKLRSIEELEILLLLISQQDRSFTAADAGKELSTGEHSAALRLAHLLEIGYVVAEEGQADRKFRYRRENAELDRDARQLASD